jgi:Uma2 family endonuclease
MSAQTIKMYSQEEYLELERAADYKSEYYRGEIFAMSGASRAHNRINENLSGEVYLALKNGTCQSFSRDLRVHVRVNTLYTYPDLIIVCGEPELLDEHEDTLLNPTVIFEILSPSTARYDQVKKFQLYTGIPSLKDYVLIDSRKIAAHVYSRESGGSWILSSESYDIEGSIHIKNIELTLQMSDIYRRTKDID